MPEDADEKPGGKLAGWKIRLMIDVTRADNWLDSSGHWHFATFEYPDQFFDSLRYSRDQAIGFFMERNSAEKKSESTEIIDEVRYKQLEAVYNSEARANRGAPE